MEAHVLRYTPGDGEGSYQRYRVPYPADGSYTVMDVLDYIREHLDGSLAYYRHSVCGQGICGRCALRVNGAVKLACTCRVETETLTLEPKSRDVVKDLVTK